VRDWDGTIGSIGFLGNIGLRAYETEVTSSGAANIGPVTVVKKYDGILPSLNATFKLRDNLLLRTALSRNINRPTLGAMAVYVDFSAF
jgi:outer membrane receptor protein involved in Fe transport